MNTSSVSQSREPMTPLLVGVDGSEANRAALAWAIGEAERSGTPLAVGVAAEPWEVVGPYPPPEPGVPGTDLVQAVADRALEEAALRLGKDRVTAEVRHGHPVRVLLDLAEGYGGLVVGKRGMGAIKRLLIGSTSIAVAGRAPVPVVVVPDGWDAAAAADRPVLVGLDVAKEHDAALRCAFALARERNVALHVLQGWQPHPLLVGEAYAAIEFQQEWQDEARRLLESYVEATGKDFPDVTVSVSQELGHPVHLLADRGRDTQLLVLGRDRKERWSGFTLGSVARGVLHLSDVPVAVVPAD